MCTSTLFLHLPYCLNTNSVTLGSVFNCHHDLSTMATTEKPSEGTPSLYALPYPAHTLPHSDVLNHLSTNPETGLSTSEAANRLTQHGPNQLSQGAGVQPLRIFIEQIFNAMTLVLLLALGASFGIQAWIEGGILGGIIVFNILLGFVQTLKAERTIESLKTLGSPEASVLRDGRVITVNTSEIVRVPYLSPRLRREVRRLSANWDRYPAISLSCPPATQCPRTSVCSPLSI